MLKWGGGRDRRPSRGEIGTASVQGVSPGFIFSSRIKLNTFNRIDSSTGQASCLKIIILNRRNSLLFSSPSLWRLSIIYLPEPICSTLVQRHPCIQTADTLASSPCLHNPLWRPSFSCFVCLALWICLFLTLRSAPKVINQFWSLIIIAAAPKYAMK